MSARGTPIPASWALHYAYRKNYVAQGWTQREQAWSHAVALQRALHQRGIQAREVMSGAAFVERMRQITVDELRRV